MAVGIDVRGVPGVMAALDKLGGAPMKSALQKASTAGAKALKPFIKAEAPRGKTGKLRRSISARKAKRDLPAAIVSARPKVAFYRHMVVGGTKPHSIGAPGQLLTNRQDFTARGPVRHPGARANPFIARGYAKGESAALAAIDKSIDDYLETL